MTSNGPSFSPRVFPAFIYKRETRLATHSVHSKTAMGRPRKLKTPEEQREYNARRKEQIRLAENGRGTNHGLPQRPQSDYHYHYSKVMIKHTFPSACVVFDIHSLSNHLHSVDWSHTFFSIVIVDIVVNMVETGWMWRASLNAQLFRLQRRPFPQPPSVNRKPMCLRAVGYHER